MSELNDEKPPEQAPQVPAEAERRSPASRWRRRGIGSSLLTAAGSFGAHAIGGPETMLIGAGVAAAGVGGVVLWHLPKVRHHFNDGRRDKKTRTKTRVRRAARSRSGGVRRAARPGSSRSRLARPGGASRRAGGALARRPGTRAASPLKRARRSGTLGGTGRKTGTPRRHGAGTRARGGTARGPLSRHRGTARPGTRRAGMRKGGTSASERRGTAGTRRGLLGRGGAGARNRPGTARHGSARTGAGRRGFFRPGSKNRNRTGQGTRTRTGTRNGSRPGSRGTSRSRFRPMPRLRAGRNSRAGAQQRSGAARSRTQARGQSHTRSRGFGRLRFGVRRNGPMPPATGKARRPKGSRTRMPRSGRWDRMQQRVAVRRRRRQRQGKDFRPVRLLGRVYRGTRSGAERARTRARLVRRGVARTRSRLARRVFRRKGQMPRPASNPGGVRYTMHPPKAEQPPRPAQPRPQAAGHTEPLPSFARQPVTVKSRVAADSPLTQAAEAAHDGFAGFDPHNAAELRGMFDDLPGFFEALASGVSALAARFGDELPVDSRVAEYVRDMVGDLASLHGQADDLKATFEQAHETELARIDNPRPAEEVWDVNKGQAG